MSAAETIKNACRQILANFLVVNTKRSVSFRFFSQVSTKKTTTKDNNKKQSNMEQKTIKQLKKGEFFRTTENGPVWVRGYYVAEIKKYECYKFDDCNHENFFKGSKTVFVGFEF